MKFNFKLNKLQEETSKLRGESIIISSPTGTGKTEAFLLNCVPGKIYHLFLPTVASCHFMYNRLLTLKEFVNVEINTSLLRDNFVSTGDKVNIIISAPDQHLIKYLDTGNSMEGRVFSSNLILDELDNYPDMAKSILLEILSRPDMAKKHVIIASASMDDGFMEKLQATKDFKLVNHLSSFNGTKYIVNNTFGFVSDNMSYMSENTFAAEEHGELGLGDLSRHISKRVARGEKVGIILNSITNLNKILDEYIEYVDDLEYRVVEIHSDMSELERLENLNALYKGEYDVVIGTDVLSFSIDVALDVLYTELSDKTSVNIQRLGRLNRRNETVTEDNLFLLGSINDIPRFMDELEYDKQFELFTQTKYIDNHTIENIRKNIVQETLPTVEFINTTHRQHCKDNHSPLSLRGIQFTFYVKTTYDRKDTYKSIKANNEFPWSWNPYDYDGLKRFIHIKGHNYDIGSGEMYGDKFVAIHERFCNIRSTTSSNLVSEHDFLYNIEDIGEETDTQYRLRTDDPETGLKLDHHNKIFRSTSYNTSCRLISELMELDLPLAIVGETPIRRLTSVLDANRA